MHPTADRDTLTYLLQSPPSTTLLNSEGKKKNHGITTYAAKHSAQYHTPLRVGEANRLKDANDAVRKDIEHCTKQPLPMQQ